MNFRNKSIQREGQNIFNEQLSKFSELHNSGMYWEYRPQEDQTDIGIDGELEVFNAVDSTTKVIFKLQLKATESVKILKKGANKGKISFQLSLRHVDYFLNQINTPLIIILCDLKSKQIYWNAVQLDSSLNKRGEIAGESGKKSIQIYFNPENTFNVGNLEKLLEDVNKSNVLTSNKFKARHKYITSFDCQPSKELHILDQLYELLKCTHFEVEYLPDVFFAKLSPIAGENPFIYGHSGLNLDVGNEDLAKLFRSIKVNQDNSIEIIDADFTKTVINPKAKFEKIIKVLRGNLIYSIRYDYDAPIILSNSQNKEKCNCLSCLHINHRYPELLDKLLNVSLQEVFDLTILMESAYLLSRLRLYEDSVRLFKRSYELALEENKYTTQFIIRFNLEKLSRFLPRWEDSDGLYDELRELDVLKEEQNLEIYRGSEFRKWIGSYGFIEDTKEKIYGNTSKVVDFYYDVQNGGEGTINAHTNLRYEYLKLVHFLERDFVVFDRFSEMRQITDSFLEGIIASHAVPENYSSRIREFDDWLIKQLVFRANPEEFRKYVRRYDLKAIDYRGDITSLLDDFIEHFKGYGKACRYIKNDKFKRNFTLEYDIISQNIIQLLGLLNLEASELNKLLEQLLFAISSYKSPRLGWSIDFMIYRKGDSIDVSTYERILKYCVSERPFGHVWTSLLIHEKMKESGMIFSFDFAQYYLEELKERYQNESFEVLSNAFPMFDSVKQRKDIVEFILESLDKEFTSNRYYDPAIRGVIPFNKVLLEKFENEVLHGNSNLGDKIKIERNGILTTSNDELRFPKLGNYINLVFKYKGSFSEETISFMAEINKYYEWLSDMESFDYSFFDPNWILEYDTRYYFRKFFESSRVKQSLKRHLTKFEGNSQIKFQRAYLNIYVLKTWEVEGSSV